MANHAKLTGKIVNGIGKAAQFTQLDWVKEQCEEKLEFSPHPGTLNIELDKASLPFIEKLQEEECLELISPDPRFCTAKVLRASIGNIKSAIIIPDKEANIHSSNIIELIAPVHLRSALSLIPGSNIEIIVPSPG